MTLDENELTDFLYDAGHGPSYASAREYWRALARAAIAWFQPKIEQAVREEMETCGRLVSRVTAQWIAGSIDKAYKEREAVGVVHSLIIDAIRSRGEVGK